MSISSNAQDVLRGRVIDQSDESFLAYATILNKRTLSGTATNLEGYFELPNTSINDTIEISFIGYESSQMVISGNQFLTIGLRPSSNVIDEIVISASDDRLYDLIQKVRKRKSTKTKTSKTYFYLESSINGEKSEVIESYYNGEYADHDIKELSLKKGRIGLDSMDGRYFLSTGTSRTFVLHNLFKANKLFPGNPLIYNKRKLKNRYWLTSKRSFITDDKIITVIDFEPKSKYGDLFEGSMQISEQGEILSIVLRKTNSQIYPFIPFGGIQISGLDLEIHKTYTTIEEEQYINTIDFNYNINYKDRDGRNVKVQSHAYCNAFDFQQSFELPYFEFSQHMHQDYRDITAAPYDTVFWQSFDEFRFYDKLIENEKFILDHQLNNSFVIHQDSTSTNQLETPYYNWSSLRFKITPLGAKEILRAREKTIFESDLYNLNTKLYVDVNRIQDSVIYQIVSILDPVDTYYKLSINTNDHHFMNLYFDLLEYHKIRLDKKLKTSKLLNFEQVREIIDQIMDEYDKDRKQFLKDCKRGKNIKKMAIWNDYLFELTQVDNQINIP